jgi:hypothetical protein
MSMPLDARASAAVGGVLLVIAPYAFGVVAIPAALFLLRDRIGQKAVIWGSLAAACVGFVLGLSSAWQWWKANGAMASSYPDVLGVDSSTLLLVMPVVAAVVVAALSILAMNRPRSADPGMSPLTDPSPYRPFGTADAVVILVSLAYLALIQPGWFY